MQNVSQLLGISLVVILGLLVISVLKVTFAAFRSTFSGEQFDYKFDKKRLPRCGRVILIDMGIYFGYALIVMIADHQGAAVSAGTAIGFSLIALPFTALACLLSVCYVPRDQKKTHTR